MVSVRTFIVGSSVALTIVTAAITVVIMNSFSMDAAAQLARAHVSTIASKAQFKVESFLEKPVSAIQGIQYELLTNTTGNVNGKRYATPNYTMDSDPNGYLAWWDRWFSINRASNFMYFDAAAGFEDGTYNDALQLLMPQPIFAMRLYRYYGPGNSSTYRETINYTDNTLQSVQRGWISYDPRQRPWYKSVAKQANALAWTPPYMTTMPMMVVIAMTGAMVNASGNFIGVVTFVYTIDYISTLLSDLQLTTSSAAVLIDSSANLLATSFREPFSTQTPIDPNSNATVPSNCLKSDVKNGAPISVLVCRHTVFSYPYAALNVLAQKYAMKTISQSFSTPTIVTLDDSTTYYVSAVQVHSAVPNMGWQLILIVPESDINGDIIKGRNLAIGITAAFLAVACICVFVAMGYALVPLQEAAETMERIAKLDDTSDTASTDAKKSHMFTELSTISDASQNLQQAMSSFTKYVPKQVVKDLMMSGQICELEMSPLRVATLFVDIAHFTTMCERVSVDRLSVLIKMYFERMTAKVQMTNGIVDKFIGDCIMAVWGAPFRINDREKCAVLCAIMMQQEVEGETLRTAFEQSGEHLEVRVGVNSGVALAGNMGSESRMSYTIIGDTVNLAARLESLNKQFGTHIMISESVLARAADLPIVIRLLGKIAVVGKYDAVRVYEVLGMSGEDTTPKDTQVLDVERNSRAGIVIPPNADHEWVNDYEVRPSSGHSAGGGEGDGEKWQQEFVIARTEDIVARALQGPRCTPRDHLFARQMTHCVHQYHLARFNDALQSLEELLAHPDAKGWHVNPSVVILRDLIMKAKENPSSFKGGVFVSNEK